jgi:formamidopyrimidine-DNA glycosylase
MPELPEVETIKRELEKAVVGKKITKVSIINPKVIKEPSPAKFKKAITRTTIKGILRKAKLLIIELSNGKFLTVHLKMTGQLIYPGQGSKLARVVFSLSCGKNLDFNDGRLVAELRLVDDWQKLKFIQRLGPEPFALSPERFREMLSSRRTKIKPLLLDQTFICGVGNIYANEALFRAKINPGTPANSLSAAASKLLLDELKNTLKEAIRCKGSSVDQYVQLSGAHGSYVKYHKVYDRKGKPCFRCRTRIERISLGGRGTYFCPRCQK